MTATEVKRRRGTAAQVAAMTPAAGEIVVNTTNNRLHVGDATTAGGIILPNAFDAQNNAFSYAVAGGTGNALTATLIPAALSYTAGLRLSIKLSAANTGAATINVNGLGVKNILKSSGGSLVSLDGGEFFSGGVADLVYDGTQFQLLNVASATTGGGGGLVLLDVQSGSGVSSLQFTTGVSSTYTEYLLKIADVIPSGTGIAIGLQQRIGGAWQTGSNTYPVSGSQTNTGTNTLALYEPIGATYAALMPTPVGPLSTVYGHVEIYAQAGKYPVYTYHMSDSRQATSPNYININASARFTGATTQVDGFRIIPSSGTITGRAMLYGYQNTL